MPISTEFQAEIEKKAHKKRAPLEDSGSNLPTYLGLVFGKFFFDAAWIIIMKLESQETWGVVLTCMLCPDGFA